MQENSPCAMENSIDGIVLRPFSKVLANLIEKHAGGNVARFGRWVNSVCRDIIGEDKKAISTALLHKYLTGSEPRLDKLRYIAYATGVSIAHLAGISNGETDGLKYYVRYFPNIWDSGLERAIEKAMLSIDFLFTRPGFLLERTPASVSNPLRYIDVLVKRAQENKRLRVRLLMLQPESLFASRREIMISGEPLNDFEIRKRRMKWWENIENIQETTQPLGDRFQMKFFDNLPTRVASRIDDWIFFAPITENRLSRESTTFKLHIGMPSVQETFYEHFVSIWNRSYPLKNLRPPDD